MTLRHYTGYYGFSMMDPPDDPADFGDAPDAQDYADARMELPGSATDAEIERMAWRLFEARRNDNGEDGTDEC